MPAGGVDELDPREVDEEVDRLRGGDVERVVKLGHGDGVEVAARDDQPQPGGLLDDHVEQWLLGGEGRGGGAGLCAHPSASWSEWRPTSAGWPLRPRASRSGGAESRDAVRCLLTAGGA